VLTIVCTPVGFRRTESLSSLEHCTLAIEGMSAASRIWGVIIVARRG
jgi:hypothetical protein